VKWLEQILAPMNRLFMNGWTVALLLLAAAGAGAAETGTLDEHLEPLRPYLGRTWRGEFKNSTPEKPMMDVSRWERALNGKAVRITHSVNDGQYGGESLIYWDADKKSLAYFYLTTAGFRTTGTMTVEKGRFTSLESVTGSTAGITEVRATGELRDDGVLVSKSEYRKNGEWVPGHEITYREDPKARPVFK
jgi:hypothetical protein